MADDKTLDQLTALDGNNITSSMLLYAVQSAIDYSLQYGDDSGLDGTRGLLYKLKTDLQATYTDETISANSSKNINLGSSTVYQRIEIKYGMKRGSNYRGGTIEVTHDGSNAYFNDAYQPTSEDTNINEGIEVSFMTAVTGQIILTITTDNSDSNDTEFKYRISEQIPLIT